MKKNIPLKIQRLFFRSFTDEQKMTIVLYNLKTHFLCTQNVVGKPKIQAGKTTLTQTPRSRYVISTKKSKLVGNSIIIPSYDPTRRTISKTVIDRLSKSKLKFVPGWNSKHNIYIVLSSTFCHIQLSCVVLLLFFVSNVAQDVASLQIHFVSFEFIMI